MSSAQNGDICSFRHHCVHVSRGKLNVKPRLWVGLAGSERYNDCYDDEGQKECTKINECPTTQAPLH